MSKTNATTSKSSAKSAKSAPKSKHANATSKRPAPEAQRYAQNRITGGALKFVKLGALGGRGARTSAIENVIASAGAKGASIREIEQKTGAAAVAMHVRTLYSVKQLIGRKRDELTGAFKYFIASAKKSAKSKKSAS